ncbi:MAG: hypothetical protein LBF81_06285 [Prevotellaceae bacterium]|jgi:uncharacterized protein (TIGR02145 family)|nr:hypothetical protein [Prevotellaceae bacterium]
MKKIIFLFAIFANVAASATVTVTPLSTDYAAKKVTFKVEWTNTPTAPYSNRVWIWIDFCPVNGVTPQSFSTATIASPTITSGNGTITNITARGFFIEHGATNAGTTVTATLSNALTGKFNWCAYGSDYPPNATINNGTYTLKGTPPFTINTSITENGASYSGGCITSLTDKTGCPGIINHPFSAGAINSSSTMIRTNAIPAAITSNTAASSGGGFTYRWVRSGTSSATYADNNAGHSFASSEVNTAGTWTYYREVRDNTCATTTWSRSAGSYVLTVITCPYTGSDLYLTSSYLCQQRTSGAKNWQAYIRDSRDSEIYRIVLMPDGKWWLAQNVKYAGTGETITVGGCTKELCGRWYTYVQSKAAHGGTSGDGENIQGVCPNGWVLPALNNWQTMFQSISTSNTIICQSLRQLSSSCTPINDTYGWAAGKNHHYKRPDGQLFGGEIWWANEATTPCASQIDQQNWVGSACNVVQHFTFDGSHQAAVQAVAVRCFRQL